MKRCLAVALLIACGACSRGAPAGEYLFVWAGDSAGKASDFLAVIDATPFVAARTASVWPRADGNGRDASASYGGRDAGNGHLLANGFHAGRTWLYDLSEPREPKILASFGDVAGFSHPHTYIRLANGTCSRRFSTRQTLPARCHEAGATMR